MNRTTAEIVPGEWLSNLTITTPNGFVKTIPEDHEIDLLRALDGNTRPGYRWSELPPTAKGDKLTRRFVEVPCPKN